MKYSTVVLALFIMVGCSENQTKKKKLAGNSRVKEMVLFNIRPSESGIDDSDMRLSIKDTTHTDSTVNYEVVSIFRNNELGFMISIPKKSKTSGFGDGFVLKSLGKPSNFFLYILSVAYKQEMIDLKKFVDEIKVSYVDLRKLAKAQSEKNGGEPYTIGGDYKLFFDNHDGEEPAELFITVDSAANYIEFREKDPAYRTGILKALSKKKE
jgi:hypothetical protein